MSTNGLSSHLGDLDVAAFVDRVWRSVRAIPVRYALFAVAASVLLYEATVSTPWMRGEYAAGPSLAFVSLGWHLTAYLIAVAPLLALRWVGWATIAAALPALPAVLSDGYWPFTVVASLVAVAMIAFWRSARLALLPAGVALGLVTWLFTGHTHMVVLVGTVIDGQARGPWYVASVVGLYALAMVFCLGIAWWMRERERDLARREVAVAGAAVEVGERARLARDLHDVVAHHVSLIAVRAETAPYTHPDLSTEARTVLGEIAGDARSALDELRGVLGVLRRSEDGAADLVPQPTLAEVGSLVTSARAAGGTVTLTGDLTARVGSTAGYVAYRVVQEALTNARRHAPTRPVAVTVELDDLAHLLVVTVTNALSGDSADANGAQRGLVGMRERVEAVRGSLVAEPRGGEFVVQASIPAQLESS